MSATLTDRYVAETLRGIRAENQEDVRAELRASISDAVEARIEQGEDPDEAERAALDELGDPARLAAGLADRPLQLIGPQHYLTWLRVLRLLLAIVPLCIAALGTIDPIAAGAGIGWIVAEALAAGVTGAMHVFFWVTLGFALAERIAASGPASAAAPWTVERLPARPPRRSAADPIAAALVLVVAALGFWWDRAVGWIVLDGEVVPIFSPDLWPWWMAGLFALFALIIAFQLVLYARGRWTTALAVANTALHVVAVSWFVTLLARGDLFSDRLVEALTDRGATAQALLVTAVVTGIAVAAVAAGAVADGWVKRARDARAA